MNLRALIGLASAIAIMASHSLAFAQSSTVTKDEIQGSINAGNTAATTSAANLPNVLPGYGGDASNLQGLYGKSPSDLAANGTAVGTVNGQSSLNTASSTYKANNPIDANADWVKNALNVQSDPQGTTEGVGTASNSCVQSTQTSTSQSHSAYTCEIGQTVETSQSSCTTLTSATSTYVCGENWVDGQSSLVPDANCNKLSSSGVCQKVQSACTTASTYESATYSCYQGTQYSYTGYSCNASWVDGQSSLVKDATCNSLSAQSNCTNTGATCTQASTYETASYNCYSGNTYSTSQTTCNENWVDGQSSLVKDGTCQSLSGNGTCSVSGQVCTQASTYENASYNCYSGNSYSSSQSTCSSSHTYTETDQYQYVGYHDNTSYSESEDAAIYVHTCSSNAHGTCQSAFTSAGCTQYTGGSTLYFICSTNKAGGLNVLQAQYVQSYQKFVSAGCTLQSSTSNLGGAYSTDTWICNSQVGGATPTNVIKSYTDNGTSSTCGSLASNGSCSKSGTTCTQTIDAGVASYFGLDPNTCVASTDTYTCTTSTPVSYCDAAPSGSGWSCGQSGTSYQSSGGVSNAITVTSYSCQKQDGVNGCKTMQDTYTCTTTTPVNYCDAAPSGSGWSCGQSGTSYQSSGGVSNAVKVTSYSCQKEDGVNGCKTEQDTYSCETATTVNYCTSQPTGSGWTCSQTKQSCQSSGTHSCAIQETDYNCSKQDGVAGCKQNQDTYQCLNAVSGVNTATAYTQATDASACQAYTSNGACTLVSDTCDNYNNVPDNLQGTYGSQTCRNHTYTYQCQAVTGTQNNCSVPNSADTVCTAQADSCLGTDTSGNCVTTQKNYDCVTTSTTNISGQVCKASWQVGDTGIEASDDADNSFGQSAAAINALAAAAKSFRDSGSISVFAGDDLRCKKAVFGLYNCCKDSGLLLDANIVGCSSDEKKLMSEQKDKATHYVGTYCSNRSFFGTCLEKKMTYCGFGSVLARVIAEAGYKQLNKSWGEAKSPNCNGFTIDEFSQLDLTNVDFSEFYSSVMAKIDTTAAASKTSTITATITNMMANKSPTN